MWYVIYYIDYVMLIAITLYMTEYVTYVLTQRVHVYCMIWSVNVILVNVRC